MYTKIGHILAVTLQVADFCEGRFGVYLSKCYKLAEVINVTYHDMHIEVVSVEISLFDTEDEGVLVNDLFCVPSVQIVIPSVQI